jgi:hypothetical protein
MKTGIARAPHGGKLATVESLQGFAGPRNPAVIETVTCLCPDRSGLLQ